MTDDFEADLRRRLADLADSADHDRPWADPLPAATAPTTSAPEDDVATVVPLDRPGRRRWLPAAAVAAVVLALVAGGAVGLRALVRESGTGSSGSAAMAGNDPATDGGVTAGGAAPGGSKPEAGSGGSAGSCDVLAAATSTGPLADLATIRSSGIVAPSTTPGGAVGVTYQLTFGQAAGTAQLRPASALLVQDGSLCASTGTVRSGVVEAVPVAPGPGQSGSTTFAAVTSTGAPLPAGEYQLAIVIPYSVDGSGLAQLVSPPVTVTVGGS